MKMTGMLRSRSSCLNHRQTSSPDISGMVTSRRIEIRRVGDGRLDGELAARDRPGYETAALEDRDQESQVLGGIVHDEDAAALQIVFHRRPPIGPGALGCRRSRSGPPSGGARSASAGSVSPMASTSSSSSSYRAAVTALPSLPRSVAGERPERILVERVAPPSRRRRRRLPARAVDAPSSTSRTFRARSAAVNGLARKCVPASSTPWWTIASSV